MLVKATVFDDIQKSMKYGFWTSSVENNKMLSAIYSQAQTENKEVYLIVGTNCDTNAYGVAKLESNMINDQFPLWW